MTSGESTSGNLSDFEYRSRWPLNVVPGGGAEVWGVYIQTRRDEGDSRRGEDKEMGACPLPLCL
jgi:hypothetical protein